MKSLEKKIAARQACIAVLGLGYVGLPLAVSFAKKGFFVIGLDKDVDRVWRVTKKQNYILDVAARDLAAVVNKKRLMASTDFSLLKDADVIIICVPTPLKRKYTPDISYIVDAVKTVSRFIRKKTLVVLESTTYPGTTRELIQPALETSGLKIGKDIYLSFSPERIDPGNPHYDVTRIPKVVGGVTPESGKLTRVLYKTIIKKIHLVSSAQAAEMTKLLENSFRIINIGWINEVAMMCHQIGIDVWEVIEAAKTKPFGFMPFYPGLGVGGHCIPDDPLYLYWKAKQYGFSSRYIKLSADTNAGMPQYAVNRLKEILKGKGKELPGARLLVLGVTYKKDVKDLRKSPPLKLIDLLQKARCRVDYFDPLIPYVEFETIHLRSINLKKTQLSRYDAVIVATEHSRVDYADVLKRSHILFDTRNIYKDIRSPKIFKL